MNEPASPDPTSNRPAEISDSQGFQVGDRNLQVNFLFGGRQSIGPAVAGNIPQEPPAFQLRSDLIAQIREAGPGVSVVRAVAGMPGIGKTQLAAAYARECINAGWRLVAWVNAESAPSILSGLAIVADRLGIGRMGAPSEEVAAEVRNRLEADGDRCLLIYDNVTSPDEVRPYIPAAGKCQVLVTSTQESVLGLGKQVKAPLFTELESLAFLAERTSLNDSVGANDVAEELGNLPLALAQAAAVIKRRHLTYEVYLDRLRAHPTQSCLPAAKGEPYPRGTAEAILMSVDTATTEDPIGVCNEILGLVSLLSPHGVNPYLLHMALRDEILLLRAERPAAFSMEGTDEEIDEAIGVLADSSLLVFTREGIACHRLIMRIIRERSAQEGTLPYIVSKAVNLIKDFSLSLDSGRLRGLAPDLLSHVTAIIDHVTPLYPELADDAELLTLHGWALSNLASGYLLVGRTEVASPLIEEALNSFARALANHELALGEGNPDRFGRDSPVSGYRFNLAMTYARLGRQDDAILLYERTLVECRQLLGEGHPDTLMSQSNVAGSYYAAGRATEAASLLEQSLTGLNAILGPEDPATIFVRENLARIREDLRHEGRS